MLREPTTSDPIQNRKLTKDCWDGRHARMPLACGGWFSGLMIGESLRCECLCHESAPPPKVRKLKPSDSLDLPDVGTITVGP